MNRKLTLSVDNSVIEKAKKYAKKHNESLSELVEDYFRIITADSQEDPEKEKELSPFVEELLGSIKLPQEFNMKNERYEYLKEKYK
ncbi:MAG: hypothetical protein JW874_00340 [Spirochaetales bacterium]|nr:hypothetical protein [Spirochaetales bacterium]